MKNKLQRLNLAQFYIQLLTAVMFMYIAITILPFNIIRLIIAILLIVGWSLGFWKHRIVRRRLKQEDNSEIEE